MVSVLKYINDHLRDRLTLEETAIRFGYSKWHFCDFFKQYTGLTFTEYVRRRRMQSASMDVIDGCKLIDIAMNYSYETQAGFNKAFLAEFGCMPSEFKEQEKHYRYLYEERKMRMLPLTSRCEILRNDAVNIKSHAKFMENERNYWFLKGIYEVPQEQSNWNSNSSESSYWNSHLIASGISSVILNHHTLIQEGELIVGCN